jgi:hypothetical protein
MNCKELNIELCSACHNNNYSSFFTATNENTSCWVEDFERSIRHKGHEEMRLFIISVFDEDSFHSLKYKPPSYYLSAAIKNTRPECYEMYQKFAIIR